MSGHHKAKIVMPINIQVDGIYFAHIDDAELIVEYKYHYEPESFDSPGTSEIEIFDVMYGDAEIWEHLTAEQIEYIEDQCYEQLPSRNERWDL